MTIRRFGRNTSAAFVVCAACLLSASLLADEPTQFSPWSAPTNLGATVNSTTGDFFPFVSKDGLGLYFTVSTCPAPTPTAPCRPDGYGGWDIYVSQRDTADENWGYAQNLGPTINTEFDEGAPSLSVDGHVMFFASDRPGGMGGNDLYVSRRTGKRDDFGWLTPENLGNGVNTAFNESSPEIFADDTIGVRTLYFDSNRPGGFGPFTDDSPANNGNDIYASVHQPDGTFGIASLVVELSTEFVDRAPSIRRDGLEIFLTSSRPGGLGAATPLDLWVSTRASTSEPWSAPVNMGSVVNSASNDAGGAVSFDGTTLYFHSARPGGVGAAFDLYEIARAKLK